MKKSHFPDVGKVYHVEDHELLLDSSEPGNNFRYMIHVGSTLVIIEFPRTSSTTRPMSLFCYRLFFWKMPDVSA